jgi:hypothetical protein
MSITTNNTTYHDDFNIADPNSGNNFGKTVDDKNYLRILFKPGYSVQVRELNQIQSILQSQIDKFGSSVWKDGAAAIGGNVSFDKDILSVDVTFGGVGSTPVDPSGVTKISYVATVGGLAKVLYADVMGYSVLNSSLKQYRLYVRYSSTIIDGANVISVFPIGATIQSGDTSEIYGTATADGYAVGLFLSKGVFFTKGSFVATPDQRAFYDIATPNTNVNALGVLNINESYITYNSDITLVDNANGTLNYSAPGADRYAINLTLGFLDAGTVVNADNTINLVTIKNSEVVLEAKIRYTDIDRQLAQRTYEESGNYTVDPFKIDVRELYNDGTNNGRYLGAELDKAGYEVPISVPDLADAKTKFFTGIEPSTAYVNGYRIQSLEKIGIIGDKARDISDITPAATSSTIGNYLTGVFTGSVPFPVATSVSNVYSLKDSGSTTIGTCRVRAVEQFGSLYRLYIYDIKISSLTKGIFDIASVTGFSVVFTVDAAGALQLSSNDTSIFKLPYDTVSNVTDISYYIKRDLSATLSGVSSYTWTLTDTNETFADISTVLVKIANVTVTPTIAYGSGGTDTKSIVLTFGSSQTGALQVIASVRVKATLGSSISGKSKTKTTVTNESYTPTAAQTVFTLNQGDLFSLDSVKFGVTSGTALIDCVDITKDFVLSDNGQRDTYYTNGAITYKGSSSFTTANRIYVTYKYNAHGSSAYQFFTAGSYQVAGGYSYSDIPSYKGTRLSDVIDFRPLILAGSSGISIPQVDPFSPIECNIQCYLSRIDKVILNSNSEFLIVRGTPAVSPVEPDIGASAMNLYTLNVPAYTFKTSDIKINYIDNKRYTMRDIGSIDKRIQNLEYYTSLSLLEKSATDKPIFDTGGARYKNGILVDNFVGHSIGDVFNSAYNCSIDSASQVLRPHFKTQNIDLVKSTVLEDYSNVSINENTITLAFTEAELISQQLASETESVNPYEVAAFIGDVKLTPATDEWIEVTTRPDVIINETGAYDAFVHLAESTNVLGTQWNNWQTSWTGVNTWDVKRKKKRSWWRGGSFMQPGHASQTLTQQVRTGTTTTLGFTDVQENTGERIIDISFIPFIRSRKVYFNARGLKPNTQVFPFFDDIDISLYSMPVLDADYIQFADRTDTRIYTGLLPGTAGSLSAVGITSAPIITDSNGSVKGVFTVPNNSALKFRTGTRKFRLTDSVRNIPTEATTFADSNYIASGSAETRESTIISTRTPEFRYNAVTDSRTLLSPVTTAWYDPLAQSFIIGNIPSGIFASSIDLYFSSKSSSSIPVSAHLVIVENGIPTQRIVPFSKVMLNASEVSTSENGSVATNFAFSDPVYLVAGAEYAIVVISNDPNYRLWVAKLGGTDVITNKKIDKNVYAGVMFMSQNASTWTPDQNRDLKFKINRAVFTTGSGSAKFNSLLSTGVESVTVTVPGSYSSTPIVLFDMPSESWGVRAEGTATINPINGAITSITVTNKGSGYTTAPNVKVSTVTVGTGNLLTVPISTFNLTQRSTEVSDTFISNSLLMYSNSYAVDNNENYDMDMVYTASAAGNSPILTSTLFSSNDYVSPVIDLDNISLLTIENEVNNDITNETTLDAGNAKARYITRLVELNNPADWLNIYVNVNLPTSTTNIKVYAKFKYSPTDSSGWNLIEPTFPIALSSNDEDYNEVQYAWTPTTSAKAFVGFSVKIVMTSDSNINIPTIRDFRAIATT